MRYALVSDVHNRRHKLVAVLRDAQQRGAEQVISLGDVGGEECLALLRAAGARAVFGNYEVSGWRHLQPDHRSWVQGWQPMLAEDSFMAVHAVPWWPEGLHTVTDFGQWLATTGQGWRALFPYLSESEGLLWRALAELESADKTILFHGHTHRQSIWCWRPQGRLSRVKASTVSVEAGARYCVGVGSVGLPEDGAWAAYTLYDAGAPCLEQVRLSRPS
jgi:predicted phosphodiesterase